MNIRGEKAKFKKTHGVLVFSILLLVYATFLDETQPVQPILSASNISANEPEKEAYVCTEPHSEPDGGDCQALLGELRRPEWACLSDMRAAIPVFVEIYKHRPFKDNTGGMRFDHSFALWYILKHLQPQPKTVIESGAFKGHSTWVIRQALPNARILSLDPNPPAKRLNGVEYMVGKDWTDLAKVNWKSKGIEPSKAVLFIDDHQSAYRRVFLEMKEQGFHRFMLEDNYPFLKGDNMSFKWTCEVEREYMWPGSVPDNFGNIKRPLTWAEHMKHVDFLRKALTTYYEFPPIASSKLSLQTRFDPKYTSIPIVTEANFFETHLAPLRKSGGEFNGYTHFAYVEINPTVVDAAPGF